MPRGATSRTSLGMLVRERREGLRLSMDDLAGRARVSRSTLHRIEHDHEIRPTAPKLAQILTVLEITPDEVRVVLKDEHYLGDVLHWMERSSAFVDAAQGLRPRPALAHLAGANEAPDFVAIKDGRTAEVRGDGLDELKEILKDSGWLVMRPD
jgi:transcriptional regulator with XRE-family HTH domain